MQIELVLNNATEVRYFPDFEAVEAAGFQRTGAVGGSWLRDDLRGQPCLRDFCGPMAGRDGALRYEDASSNDRLSC